MRISLLLLLSVFLLVGCSNNDGWISLFDGKTLDGWQASENVNSFKVEDGSIVCDGPRSHLFYVGEVNNANFKNFEFTADVKTSEAANSGIYIHTEFLDEGWPEKGYETQINNTHFKDAKYIERKLTGSIYAIRNTYKSPVADNEWFNYHILVQGKTIQIRINGELISDYTEQENPWRPGNMKGRVLSSGTFAFQCHDPKSLVHFKNIKVKPLADDMPQLGEPLNDKELDQQLTFLASKNFPLMDLHVHLKGGLDLNQAQANSRLYGITHGYAVNCGFKFPIDSDEALDAYLKTYKKPPHTYLAMQAEGREWTDLFSKDGLDRFDYVFTDAMTWTNKNGKRMRLWIKEETEIGDKQDFMEQLVSQMEKIFSTEPIDIYVNSTFLPAEIADEYDELWTTNRMDRVIKALKDNNIALEINARRGIPSAAYIKRAKVAGVKFTFGTNNGGKDDLGNLDYCLEMIKECGLTLKDMWIPGE